MREGRSRVVLELRWSEAPRWGALVALGAALVCLGCEPAEEEEPTQAAATEAPTPTAEPTPTPVPPMDAILRVQSMAITAEDDGLDLTGDDRPDNGIYEALDVAGQAIVAAVAQAARDAYNEGKLDEDQVIALVGAATVAVSQTLTVDALNQALAASLTTTGLAFVPELRASRSGGDPDLVWWLADAAEGVPALMTSAGTLGVGAWDLSGATQSEFGPGSLSLPLAAGPDAFGFVVAELQRAEARLSWSDAGVEGALLAGGVDAALILAGAEVALDALDTQLAGLDVEFSSDEVLANLHEVVEDAADMSCQGGEPCISVSLRWSGQPTAVIVDPDGDGQPGIDQQDIAWSGPIAQAIADVIYQAFGPLIDAIADIFTQIFDDLIGGIIDAIIGAFFRPALPPEGLSLAPSGGRGAPALEWGASPELGAPPD